MLEILLALTTSAAQPTPVTQPVPPPAGAFTLASAMLQAFSLAGSARDRLAGIKSSDIGDTMTPIIETRGAANRIREASLLLQQFSKSEPSIKEAAEGLQKVLGVLSDALMASVALWDKFALAKTADEIRALVPEGGKVVSDVDEAWRLLPLGMVGVTHALVDDTRVTNGKVSHLRVTRSERAKLAQEIANLFPTAKPGAKGLHAVESSVKLFGEFLNGGWKSSDDK